MGRPPATEIRGQFAKYLELLIAWNRTHHLTGYREPRDVVRGLFIDSLLFVSLLPRQRPIKIVDIGAGPGIPGIPLRIADREIRLTVVESRRKPVSFLATVKRELGLGDVEVIHGRAGREPGEFKGQHDCAVTRSVRLDEELVLAALGYLAPGGKLISSAPPHPGSPELYPGARIERVRYPALGYSRNFIVVVK